MKIAEKILKERKRLGLSQEQLAEELDVSRQAVSKWESGQSMPDLDKLVLLSRFFKVSADYLLKEDITSPNQTIPQAEYSATDDISPQDDPGTDSADTPTQHFIRTDSMVQAPVSARTLNTREIQDYQATCFKASKTIASGVSLCIIGVILFMVVELYVTASTANSLSTIALLICVAPAVALFISSGMKMESYNYLKTDSFQLTETYKKQLTDEYENFFHLFAIKITTGVVLCIIAVIAYLIVEKPGNDDPATIVLLSFIAIAVYLFVSSAIRKEYYDVLLQQNDFSDIRKQKRNKESDLIGMVAGVYWTTVTAVFLGYSFITSDWGRSWYIWPVAGCLFGAISIILSFYANNKQS